MSFNVERMKKVRFMPAQLNDAATFHFILDSNEETLSKFVPPPLKLASPARAHFIVNHFRKTTLPGVDSYLESAILIEVEHNGEKGNLTLAMLLNDDNALIGGREFFGFPKKMGDINVSYDSESASGHIIRRKITLAEFTCKIGKKIEDASSAPAPFGEISYNIKCFPDPSLRKFDYPPRLVKHSIAEKLKGVWQLEKMGLKLNSSQFDPWDEIEPFTIVDGYKREYDSTILAGEIVAELDENEYFKYALNRFI